VGAGQGRGLLHCAATLLHNVRSQRVLERNGFVRLGLAPAYLRIVGLWQDHVLYQLIAGDADSTDWPRPIP